MVVTRDMVEPPSSKAQLQSRKVLRLKASYDPRSAGKRGAPGATSASSPAPATPPRRGGSFGNTWIDPSRPRTVFKPPPAARPPAGRSSESLNGSVKATSPSTGVVWIDPRRADTVVKGAAPNFSPVVATLRGGPSASDPGKTIYRRECLVQARTGGDRNIVRAAEKLLVVDRRGRAKKRCAKIPPWDKRQTIDFLSTSEPGRGPADAITGYTGKRSPGRAEAAASSRERGGAAVAGRPGAEAIGALQAAMQRGAPPVERRPIRAWEYDADDPSDGAPAHGASRRVSEFAGSGDILSWEGRLDPYSHMRAVADAMRRDASFNEGLKARAKERAEHDRAVGKQLERQLTAALREQAQAEAVALLEKRLSAQSTAQAELRRVEERRERERAAARSSSSSAAATAAAVALSPQAGRARKPRSLSREQPQLANSWAGQIEARQAAIREQQRAQDTLQTELQHMRRQLERDLATHAVGREQQKRALYSSHRAAATAKALGLRAPAAARKQAAADQEAAVLRG